jgi:hypothetical protein
VFLSKYGRASDIPPLWVQLTTYKATYLTATIHFRNLTASAASLVEADLDFPTTSSDDWVRYCDTATLPRLRRLVVSRGALLDSLRTPVLEDLHIHGDTVTLPHVLPFLQASQCAHSFGTL